MLTRRPRSTVLRLAWVVLSLAWLPAWASPARVTDVRLWSGPEGTRLVIELSAPVEYDVFALDDPDRIVVDLANTTLPANETLPPGQGPVKSLRSGPQRGHGLRFVLDLTEVLKPRSFVVGPDGSAGHRLVVELPGSPVVVAAPMNAARTSPAGNEVLAMVADTSRAVAAPAVPRYCRAHSVADQGGESGGQGPRPGHRHRCRSRRPGSRRDRPWRHARERRHARHRAQAGGGNQRGGRHESRPDP